MGQTKPKSQMNRQTNSLSLPGMIISHTYQTNWVAVILGIVNNLWSINETDTEKIALTNDSYWNTDPALIYVPVPQIYDMQASDKIDNNVPLISANFSCSYGNVSRVNISVDAVDVTQNATATKSNVW